LTALNDNKTARKQLKDNQEEINMESKHLFVEDFQKQLKTCAKALESAKKPLSRPNKRKAPPHHNRPNQMGSSSASTSRPSGGASSSWSNRGGRGSWKRGKNISSKFSSNALQSNKSVGPTEIKEGSPKP